MKYNSIGEMFFAKREISPNDIAFKFKEGGDWKTLTYEDVNSRSENIAAGLASLGIKKGDKIAIISANRIEWALIDYAVVSLGAILVTIYPSLLKEQVQYILNDSEAKVVFAENDIQTAKVNDVHDKIPNLKNFILIDVKNSDLKDPWKGLDALADLGQKHLEMNPDTVKNAIKEVTLDDWLTIIYTSGTTGEPKGAILTHGNLLSNIESGLEVLSITNSDVFLSFLPLSHVLERMAGHYLAYYCGTMIAYAESIEAVPVNMGEIKPTVMISVPRLYEKMYSRVLENVELGSGAKQKIFHWAVGVGSQYINKIMNKQPIGTHWLLIKDMHRPNIIWRTCKKHK